MQHASAWHCTPTPRTTTPPAENIAYFLDYTRTALMLFGKHAKYWATFNEPGGWVG